MVIAYVRHRDGALLGVTGSEKMHSGRSQYGNGFISRALPNSGWQPSNVLACSGSDGPTIVAATVHPFPFNALTELQPIVNARAELRH
jgi:hypothetical protein